MKINDPRRLAPLALAFIAFSPASASAAQDPDHRWADGVGMLQAQLGGLEELLVKAQRALELARQAEAPDLSVEEHVMLDERFQAANIRSDLIARSTQYEGVHLLDRLEVLLVQSTPGASTAVEIYTSDVTGPALGTLPADIQTQANAHEAVLVMTAAIHELLETRTENCLYRRLLGAEAGCPGAQVYCFSSPNSTGAAARIYGLGHLALSFDEPLVLRAMDCPPGETGWFFMGRAGDPVPFGGGYLCVDGGAMPLVRLGPPALVPVHGQVERVVGAELAAFSHLQPGVTWGFQFLFTDGAGSGTNLTDALRVTFSP